MICLLSIPMNDNSQVCSSTLITAICLFLFKNWFLFHRFHRRKISSHLVLQLLPQLVDRNNAFPLFRIFFQCYEWLVRSIFDSFFSSPFTIDDMRLVIVSILIEVVFRSETAWKTMVCFLGEHLIKDLGWKCSEA